jgi:hypothetical protein
VNYLVDLTKPVFSSCPAGANLGCNPTSFPAAGTAGAFDNCGDVVTITAGALGEPVNTQGCTWTRTRIYTATDACGNTETCSQVFTYTIDLVKPTIVVATAGSLPCNPTTAQIAAAFGGATVSDNCSTGLTATGVVGTETGSGCSFSTTKTWTVTDNCGNTQTATQTVNYTRDLVKPSIVVATAGTLPCNPTTAQIAAAFGGATASDNCSTGLTATGVVGTETGSGCSFSTTKTWTVTDNCGNTQTATQTLNYTRDITKPSISVTPVSTIPLPCNPTTAQITAAFGTATVSDNCSQGLTAVAVLGTETGTGCSRSIMMTWTATDNCGNTQTASQSVSYTRDTEKPTIVVATAGPLPCNPTTAQIAAAFGGATVSDNCSTGLTATGVVGTETGSGCSFSTTKTWTVTDNCGNTQTVTQTVTYTRDLTKPTVSNNAPATIEAMCTATFSTLPWSAPVFTDACGAVTLVSDVTTPGQEITVCPKVYVRVWTVMDACGNTASFTQTITVPCCEGCSPGFWKNHTSLWDQLADYPVAQMPAGLKFITSTNFNMYFNLPAGTNGFDNSLTMEGAISQGGGDCKAFARHAVAALLSSASGLNIGYPTGTSNFTSLYNAIRTALLSGNCGGTLFSQLEAISVGDHTNCGQFEPIITMNNVVNPDPQVSVSAFPNPYTDRIVFTIKSAISGSSSLELYNMLGQKVTTVYQGTIEENTVRTFVYDVPLLQRKTMVYRLRIGKETVTGTVIAPN